MALTIEVTKVSVSQQLPKLWNITLKLRCLESELEVINQNVSVHYREGEDIDVKQSETLETMQVIINKYLAEQAIFNHVKLDNLVTYLTNTLVG